MIEVDENEDLDKKYPFAVYGTQGGGLVRETSRNTFVFVEPPDPSTQLGIGDFKPDEWDYIPANRLAQQQFQD